MTQTSKAFDEEFNTNFAGIYDYDQVKPQRHDCSPAEPIETGPGSDFIAEEDYPVQRKKLSFVDEPPDKQAAKIILFPYTTDQHLFYVQFNNMIDRASFPKKWLSEKITPPNVFCKEEARRVCRVLYDKYSIIPQRISSSIEEGVFVNYFNDKNHCNLGVEIYNDASIAAIVNHGKEIVHHEDIVNIDFEKIIDYYFQ